MELVPRILIVGAVVAGSLGIGSPSRVGAEDADPSLAAQTGSDRGLEVTRLPPTRELTEAEVMAPGRIDQTGFDDVDLRHRVESVIPHGSLGASWISADGMTLYLQIIGNDEERAAAKRAADSYLQGKVEILPGTYSKETLVALADEALDLVARRGLSGVTVGLANRANQLGADAVPSIRVSGPRAVLEGLLDDLAKIVPQDLLEPVEAEPVAPLVDRDLNPPYYAGNKGKVVTPSTGTVRPCSTGFVLVNGYGYFGTLAGHCAFHGRTGDDVFLRTTKVDHVRVNKFVQDGLTDADVLTYSLSARPTSFSESVYVSSSSVRPVSSRYNGSRPVGSAYCAVGDGVDFAGRSKTAQICDTVTEMNVGAFADTGGTRSTIRHLDCSDHEAYSGWSGGPVYLTLASGSVKAAGTTSLGGLTRHCWSLINYIVF